MLGTKNNFRLWDHNLLIQELLSGMSSMRPAELLNRQNYDTGSGKDDLLRNCVWKWSPRSNLKFSIFDPKMGLHGPFWCLYIVFGLRDHHYSICCEIVPKLVVKFFPWLKFQNFNFWPNKLGLYGQCWGLKTILGFETITFWFRSYSAACLQCNLPNFLTDKTMILEAAKMMVRMDKRRFP